MIQSYLFFCLKRERKMKHKLLLIDGHNLLFKMYYGIPNSIKRNGIEIKGVIGFISVILKLYHQLEVYSIIVVFDSESSTEEKKKIDPSYKGNRVDYSQIENNPFTQLKMIQECLNYLKIPNFESSHQEADDYIASLCKKFQDQYSIIIVSTDKDFLQLVNKTVFVYSYRGKHSILYDEQEVYSKYQVTPKQIPLYLSLIGDQCDNINGIKGVGPKTAIKKIKANDTAFFHFHQDTIKKICN